MNHIEESDDVIFKFKEDSIIEVYEHEDIELHEPIEEKFAKGEVIDVTVCSVNKDNYGIQFGDGTVAFIRKDMVEVVAINF
jgi:hypothetical protein